MGQGQKKNKTADPLKDFQACYWPDLCCTEMIKVTVTNILTHKHSGLTPEPSDIFLPYNTLLSIQADPTVYFCPEWLSKPVLRTLGNVIKSRKKKTITGSSQQASVTMNKQTKTKAVYKLK